MNDILEITEQRRNELIALSLEDGPYENTPPLYASKSVKITQTISKKRGRPKKYLKQRICKCGNLARAMLMTKDVIYWKGECNACHAQKYSKVKRPRKKVFKLVVPKYIRSWSTLKQHA